MIFFDMDGVLADFNGGAKGLIKDAGLTLPAEDDWHYLSSPFYKAQVRYIATSQSFWRSLEPIKPAIEAFNLARKHSMILSSPGFPVSATPKLDWCQKHLGIGEKKVILTSAKHYLAAPGRFLIDDKSGNCQAFAEAGGSAILVELPYSYKDGNLTHETLHYRVGTCTREELPTVVQWILDDFYAA